MPSRIVAIKILLPILLSGLFGFSWLSPSQLLALSASPVGPRLANPTAEPIPLDLPLRFDKLTIEDGLSQNAILSIYQDSRGYLWIGTQDGLNRFDGYDFTVFKHELDNPNSLSHNSILSILEDRQGIFWFGTWGGGLNRYDPSTGQFTRYQHDPQNPDSLAQDLVAALYEDSTGRLWIGTSGGLDELDRQNGKFIHHTSKADDPHSLSSDVISSILEDHEGNLWIGTGGFGVEGAGLNHFDPRTGQVQRYQNDPTDPHSLSSNTISSLLLAPDGALWIGTGGFYLSGSGNARGLNRLDPQTGQVARFQYDPQNADSLSNDNVTSLYLDSNQVLWIGTWGGGLDRLDLSQTSTPGKERFYHTQHDPLEPPSLSADIVWSLMQDRSGVFWVGTINGGLNKLNPQVQRFRLYRNHLQDSNSLGFNVVGPFYEADDGKIWVGTWGGGLDAFDPRTGLFKHYLHDPNNAGSLPDNTIGSIYQDKQGVFWVGTFSGLTTFDPVTGQFKVYSHDPADPNSISDNNISKIIEDKSGRLWIASLGGLDVYDQAQDNFTHIDLPEDVQPVALFIDRNQTLWVGTGGQGLIGLDPDSLFGRRVSYTQYLHDPNNPASLTDNAVWSIYEDQRGMLWVGTQSGLDRLDRFSDTFLHYPELDRLPNNTILCILDDADGNLWISTNNGLIRFNPLKGESRKFDVSDGLQSNEFNSGACLRSREGTLIFGGIDGFNLFDPGAIQDNPVPPPVVVTALQVFNNPIATDLSGKTPIDLNYRQNFISFDFAALDYHAPDRNRYQYKLDGVDADWVEAGARRYASYTNLSGGDYIFRVKASNNDGVWNDTGLAIPVRVTPPIWQTWWFQAGAILMTVMLVAGGVGLRLEQVRAHNRQLEATVEQRTDALRHANERLEEEVQQRKFAEEELARRAAADLQQSEARFRAMFDSSSVGIGLLTLQRRVIDANPALCHMLGYSLDELLSMDYGMWVYPDDVSADIALFQGVLAGTLDTYEVEKRYIRKDGSLMDGRGTLSAVRDVKGNTQFVVGMLEDISERKRAGEALQQSEARFRAMFEHSVVAIVLMSLDRSLLGLNPATERILGYSRKELINRPALDFIYPDDRTVDLQQFQALTQGQIDSYYFEKRYIHGNGSVRWGRITHSLVRGPDRQPQYILSMMEDIDEQKHTQERMAAREAEYRQLLEQTVQVRTQELLMTNQRLQEEIEQRKRVEEALSVKAAEEAVVAERTRLARDLHDAVTQTLFSASLTAEILPELLRTNPPEALKSAEELRQLTRGALAEMRTLLLELRPAALTQTRFEDLLRQLTEALIGRARLPIRLTVNGSRRLPAEVQIALYRIAQESLNNVVKYARATQVLVDLQMSPGGVHLEIRDDGVGFDPTLVPLTSLGQRIMRERAENINADLQVASVPGKGTNVTVTWNDPEMEVPE